MTPAYLRRALFAAALLVAAAGVARAMDEEPTVSTQPIGSSFYRHLAWDTNTDLHELIKFERRGFGRAEIVTIVLISKITGAPIKDYGRRRIYDRTLLRDLAIESGLDYDTLYKIAQVVKKSIEAKGDALLPSPVFDAAPPGKESGKPNSDGEKKP